MNILFVSPEFPQSKFSPTGGIGTYLVNLSSQLIKAGHKVTLITKKQEKKYNHKSINIVEVNCSISNKRIREVSILNKMISFIEYPVLFSIKTAFIINKIIKKNNIEIIECNDFGGDLWFYLINPFIKKPVPVAVRLHTPYFVISKFNNDSKSITNRLISFFEKTAITLANSIYSPTESLAKLITTETGRKINTIIPYPFETTTLEPNIVSRKKETILYIGKLQYKKGVFNLLKVVRRIKRNYPKAYCYFIGSDTLFKSSYVSDLMKTKVEQLNILENIKIINKNIGKNELIKYYKRFSVLVVPSLWENFPNVILEAFLLGIPVVASSVGGIPEMIIDGYNGLLYKANSEKSAVRQILRIFKNPKLARSLSINARNSLKNKYNAKKITLETTAYYKNVLKYFIYEK